MWVQPACATEPDFLFGIKPRGRGTKRKKGQQPAQIGEQDYTRLSTCSPF